MRTAQLQCPRRSGQVRQTKVHSKTMPSRLQLVWLREERRWQGGGRVFLDWHEEGLASFADEIREFPPLSQSQQTTRMRPFSCIHKRLGEHVSSLINSFVVKHGYVWVLQCFTQPRDAHLECDEGGEVWDCVQSGWSAMLPDCLHGPRQCTRTTTSGTR